MKTLVCTVGLPYSGKTTWAKLQNCPIVNPDAIRLASHGQRFWGPGERSVWADAYQMVVSLFLAGHEIVIVDGCHNSRKRRDFWRPERDDARWELRFKLFNTTTAECMERAKRDRDNEILPTIERMSDEHEYLQDDELPWELGATGEYPEGKLSPADEGALRIGVAADRANHLIHLTFGTPVTFVSFPPEHEIFACLDKRRHELLGPPAGPNP